MTPALGTLWARQSRFSKSRGIDLRKPASPPRWRRFTRGLKTGILADTLLALGLNLGSIRSITHFWLTRADRQRKRLGSRVERKVLLWVASDVSKRPGEACLERDDQRQLAIDCQPLTHAAPPPIPRRSPATATFGGEGTRPGSIPASLSRYRYLRSSTSIGGLTCRLGFKRLSQAL